MKKLLQVIPFLFIFATAQAKYVLNPNTGKLDYYKDNVSTSTYASNSDKLDGLHASEIVAISTGLVPPPDLSAYLSTTTASQIYMSTGVAQILADSNFILSPPDGKGIVTVSLKPQVQYWIENATSVLNMNNYPMYNASSISISTNALQGYLQISDKFMIVKTTTSAGLQDIINNYASDGTKVVVIGSTVSFNSSLKIFKNNITIEGQGFGTVFLAQPWANWTTPADMIYSSGTSGLTLKNVKLDGNSANTGQSKSPIFLQRCDYVTIENVWSDYSDYYAFNIEGCSFFSIRNCIGTNADNAGIYNYGYDNIFGVYRGYQNTMQDNVFKDTPNAIGAYYLRAGLIQNNYIWGGGGWAITCPQVNYGITITGNTVFGATGGGIFFYGTTTNGFNCTGNSVQCAGVGALLQGDIGAGNLTNNTFLTTGANNGIEIGSYNLVSGINVLNNSVSIAGGAGKAAINAYVMSNSQIASNTLVNTSAQASCGFLLQVGTGNVITGNLAKNHTTDYQLNAFCYDNKLINNFALDAIKVRDLARETTLAVIQDGKFGFGVSSPTATVDVGGRVLVDSVWHVVGGTHTVITTVPCTQNVWSKITNASGNLFQGTEVDGFSMVTDSMVVVNAGDYWGSVMLSYAANLGNDWSFRIRDLDTGFTTIQAEGASTNGSTNIVTITIPIYLESGANNRFILEAMNTSSNDELDIHSIKFIVTYLHD